VEFVPPGGLDVDGAAPRASLRAWAVPNPMPGSGLLRFSLPRPGSARVELFDVRGRRVGAAVDAPALEAGDHEVEIPAGLGPGVYFYRVRAGGEAARGRFLVVE
jgi:hypothetical protein